MPLNPSAASATTASSSFAATQRRKMKSDAQKRTRKRKRPFTGWQSLKKGLNPSSKLKTEDKNGPQNSLILLKRYAHLTLTQNRTLFLAHTPSAFHWCSLCSSTFCFQIVDSYLSHPSLRKKTSEQLQRFFIISHFPVRLPHYHCVLVHIHGRSMSEYLSGRLDFSPPRTDYREYGRLREYWANQWFLAQRSFSHRPSE